MGWSRSPAAIDAGTTEKRTAPFATAALRGGAFGRIGVGLATISAASRIGRAADLKLLHPLKNAEELGGKRIVIEARTFESEQQFVGRFEGGETTVVRLLLDDVAAASGGREHDAWQALQAGAQAEHFSCTAPRGVEQQDYKAAYAEFGGGQCSRGEVARLDTGVEEYGDVARIVDQGLDLFVIIKGYAHVNHALRKAKVGKPTGVGSLFLEFLRVHQEHDLGAGLHRLDRRTPAVSLRPKTPITGLAAHAERDRRLKENISS